MKVWRGKGTVQASTAAYCFLTAYLPIIAVLMLPAQMFVVPAMSNKDVISVLMERLLRLSAWELSDLLLSWLLSTIVFILFFTAVLRALRMLHKLSWPRSAAAFVMGSLGSVIFLAAYMEKFESAILNLFRLSTRLPHRNLSRLETGTFCVLTKECVPDPCELRSGCDG